MYGLKKYRMTKFSLGTKRVIHVTQLFIFQSSAGSVCFIFLILIHSIQV